MKSFLKILAFASASLFAVDASACWSSNEFGGSLVCGTPENPHPATAEEIRQDQEYYNWKYGSYDKYGSVEEMMAHFEESLVGVDPVVVERIRAGWSNVQAKTQEKVDIYLEASQGEPKPTEAQLYPKK